MGSQITINGVTYRGNSIVVTNGNVIIDGNKHNPEGKTINIEVHGDIKELSVDFCDKLIITGNVEHVKSSSGDVEISGSVTGSVQSSSGEIEIGGNVGGSVQTSSGDVKCGNVTGKVSTMSGDIKYRKI